MTRFLADLGWFAAGLLAVVVLAVLWLPVTVVRGVRGAMADELVRDSVRMAAVFVVLVWYTLLAIGLAVKAAAGLL